jgi:SAM-dependent methyltransferase
MASNGALMSSLSFDQIAARYDITRGGERRGDAAAAVIEPWLPAGGPIGEIGVGTALVAAALAEREHKVIGVDISPAMVRVARERFAGPIAIADGAALPFTTGSMAAIYAVWVLHVVGDMDAVLAECRRVLRPGGRLVVIGGDPTRRIRTPEVEALERTLRHRPDHLDHLEPVATARGFRLVHAEPLPPHQWSMTPCDLAGEVEARTWSWLWSVPPEVWATEVEPVLEALRSGPDRDRPQMHQNADLLTVWEIATTSRRPRGICGARRKRSGRRAR